MSAWLSWGHVKSQSQLAVWWVRGRELMSRTLEELDGSEAKMMLLDLPPMDVDRVSLPFLPILKKSYPISQNVLRYPQAPA